MKIMLYVMFALVAGAFVKGGFDIHAAIEAGESHQTIAFGAMPMLLIGFGALFCFIKVLGQMNKAEETQSQSSES